MAQRVEYHGRCLRLRARTVCRCLSGAAWHVRFASRPGVAELADAADSKSAGALLRVGSTPSSGTTLFPLKIFRIFRFAMIAFADFPYFHC